MDGILQSILSASFAGAVLRITTPLLFPSLGALISDRAGVINIGLEGIMLTAAFTGATVGAVLQNALIGLVAGMVAGILMALLLAFFHLTLNGNLILGGVAVNILGAAGTVALGYQIGGARAGGLQLPAVSLPEVTLPFLQGTPALYDVIGAQNVLTWVAFACVPAVWFLLYQMPIGRHLRAVGENPTAAASVGIRVRRMRYLALALSGLLAGLGGLHLSMGYLSGFSREMTAGRGYIALVIPALGGRSPWGTALAALLFGVFAALETRLGSAAIPSQLPQMIPYAATLIALILYAVQRKSQAA